MGSYWKRVACYTPDAGIPPWKRDIFCARCHHFPVIPFLPPAPCGATLWVLLEGTGTTCGWAQVWEPAGSPGRRQLAMNWPCPAPLGPAVIALAMCCGSTMKLFFLKKAEYAGKIFAQNTSHWTAANISPLFSHRGFPLWQTPILQEEDSPAGSFFPGKWLNCHHARLQP